METPLHQTVRDYALSMQLHQMIAEENLENHQAAWKVESGNSRGNHRAEGACEGLRPWLMWTLAHREISSHLHDRCIVKSLTSQDEIIIINGNSGVCATTYDREVRNSLHEAIGNV